MQYDFFSELHSVIKSVCHIFDPKDPIRSSTIILKRFGFLGEDKRTLEELGEYYGITRERIRQIEAKMLKILSDVILEGQYIKKFVRKEIPYYLEKEIYDEIKLFISHLPFNGYSLLESEVETLLGVSYDDFMYKGELDFILELLNYQKTSLKPVRFNLSNGWINMDKKKLFELVNKNVNQFFIIDKFNVDFFDLMLACKKESKEITEDDVFQVINVIEGIHVNPQNRRISYEQDYLFPIDRAFLYLTENGLTDIRELTRQINIGYHRIITETNLRNQMSQDARFEAIGKSGKWQIKGSEEVINISIADAMEKSLHNIGKPLTVKELYAEIVKLRGDSFKERSIFSYASSDNRFLMLDGVVSLSIWSENKSLIKKPKIVFEDFDSVLVKFLPLDKEIRLSDIIKHFLSLGWKEQTIRGKLKRLREESILIDIDDSLLVYGPNKVVKLVKNPLELECSPNVRVLLRDRVHNAILIILKDNRIAFTKGELYLKVLEQIPKLHRHTFYTYLSELKTNKDLLFYEKDNKFYVRHN